MLKRIIAAFFFPALLIALPVLLRQQNSATCPCAAEQEPAETDELVIVSPHTEPIKYEFEQGFRKYYRAKTGRDVRFDWRNLGGTSDIARYINDRFSAEFRLAWEAAGHDCTDAVLKDFRNKRSQSDARKFFLASDIGIGIDIFFGGGTYEHSNFAGCGYAVDGGVQTRHPEYFTDIPQNFAGEVIYDKGGLYYGCCLSSFGLSSNPDRFRDEGLPLPRTWSDLTKPELFQKIGIGDPTKSGSVMKCYEMILQQAMAEHGVEKGWIEGFRRIKLIAANARIVTESAGKLVRDISSGSVMAGMSIDFYGFSEENWTRQTAGTASVVYHMPENGSAVTSDPVQMLRGAPNRKTAEHFLDYLLSPEGQKLWIMKPGTPGGPERYALLRTCVNSKLPGTIPAEYLNKPDYDPYQLAGTFRYQGGWTGRYFTLIRILIKCIALDPIDDLRAARAAMIEKGENDAAMALIAEMPFPYTEAAVQAKKLSSASPAEAAKLRREWTEFAVDRYRKAVRECAK